MITDWNYTNLAEAYLHRPNYSSTAIDIMLKMSDMEKGKYTCDVGAGAAHLTLELAARELTIKAIEPNHAMRALGEKRTKNFHNIEWFEGVGEVTNQPSNFFDMVTFGSSFNVCNPALALKETARILKPNGWLACLYNNRQLSDPIQAEIESLIKEVLPNYKYGTRRKDHSQIINTSNSFKSVIQFSSTVVHTQTVSACVKAWKSHATLARQAGSKFEKITSHIEEYLASLERDSINVPYQTNVWLAQLK